MTKSDIIKNFKLVLSNFSKEHLAKKEILDKITDLENSSKVGSRLDNSSKVGSRLENSSKVGSSTPGRSVHWDSQNHFAINIIH